MLFTNAITWANVRLRGGWKGYAGMTGAYAAVIALIFVYVSRMGTVGNSGPVLLCTLLFFVNLVVLLFFGCTAIGNAIRRDINNGLIASHRLMPVSPAAAVIGYIVGPAALALCLGAVTLAAGGAAAAVAGIDLAHFFAAYAAVLLLVAFFWVCVAFVAFISKNAFGGLFGVLFGSVSGGGFIITFVPALAVVYSPILTVLTSAFVRGGISARFTAGYAYAILAQLAFGAILFRGAMRRYRRDDVPALSTLLSFLLLGAWVLTSAVGVLQWDEFAPAGPRGPRQVDVGTQSMTAVISAALMAIIAVSASAKASTEWLRDTLAMGRAGRRPIPPPLLVLLATVVIVPLAVALRPQDHPELNFVTSAATISFAVRVAVVIAAYLLSVSYILRIVYRVSNKPVLILLLWTALTWLVPLGVDAIRKAYAPPGAADLPALYGRMSMLGELVELWRDPHELALLGIAVQLGIAAIPAALFYATEPRKGREGGGYAAGQFVN